MASVHPPLGEKYGVMVGDEGSAACRGRETNRRDRKNLKRRGFMHGKIDSKEEKGDMTEKMQDESFLLLPVQQKKTQTKDPR